MRSYLVSEAAKEVLDGKPFAAYVVCRRYWSVNLREAKKLATKQGGRFVDAIHFQYEGGQVRSLLSLLSYFGKGEMRERSLGIKIPPTNLKPDFGDQARAFANKLADGLGPAAAPTGGTPGLVEPQAGMEAETERRTAKPGFQCLTGSSCSSSHSRRRSGRR